MSDPKTLEPASAETPPHQPFIPASDSPPEFTWPAILAGTVLGIIFGASSLYLVLKVGLTVSASVPIAVLSITLFRAISNAFKVRKTTILENNVVQTAGSAGESIAFGVGVTMPALLLLGFEMDPVRVMTVSVLGAILGILMMIPLRRAFIVKQHGKLIYPEGTACAEVLVAGEKGGATAKMVFVGFGIALVYKFLTAATKLWSSEPAHNLYTTNAETGERTGINGAEVRGELAPELLGVGFLIGPRIGSLMMAGAYSRTSSSGQRSARLGEVERPRGSGHASGLRQPGGTSRRQRTRHSSSGEGSRGRPPASSRTWSPTTSARSTCFIGAGAVAAGGIISMFRALPLILGSITWLRDPAREPGRRWAWSPRHAPITTCP
ncbi:MAG: OPT/YSL family transporter [Gemmataceae bacterium]